MSIKNLFRGIVMENGVINFEKEGERLKGMWRFWKTLAKLTDLADAPNNPGEEMAQIIITRAANGVEHELKDVLDTDFGNAEYGNISEETYQQYMADRAYTLVTIAAPLLFWEERMLERHAAGDTDGLLFVLNSIEFILGNKLGSEDFWARAV